MVRNIILHPERNGPEIQVNTLKRSIMTVSEAIAKRKSVRAYESKPVSAEALEKIVEAGRWAPNAGPF